MKNNFRKYFLCFVALYAVIVFYSAKLNADQNTAVLDITANGQPAPRIITMNQNARLEKCVDGKYEPSDTICPVSPKGRIEFELPDDGQYMASIFINGGLRPLYSPMLHLGVNHWDVSVAEIQLTDEKVADYEGKLLILYYKDKNDFVDTGIASFVLKNGIAFLDLPSAKEKFYAGIESRDGDVVFSPQLIFGKQEFSIQEGKNLGAQEHKKVEVTISKQPKLLTAVWANNGEDKVTKDELRASEGKNVTNSVWDGKTVGLFGAKNEVIAFNVILESAKQNASDISINFDRLEGPEGFVIGSRPAYRQNLFNFLNRNIELFYIRYLEIKGLSRLLYMPDYDERHVPERLRLPYKLPKGKSEGRFADRPNANKFYPDIALPIELIRSFEIERQNNQSIWVDIYIPEDAPAGIYKGDMIVYEGHVNTFSIPVKLEVLSFILPNDPSAKTMLYYGDEDIYDRYLGRRWPTWSSLSSIDQQRLIRVLRNHHKLAHRHKISLIDDGLLILPDKAPALQDERVQCWMDRFSGTAFTAKYGYDGPGVGTSSGVYSIGTYGGWGRYWNKDSKADIWKHSDLWVNWFEKYAPGVEYFVYLFDEPDQDKFEDIERWAKWIKENPGPGRMLKTLVVSKLPYNRKYMTSVDIDFTGWGDEAVWRPIVEQMKKEGKEYWAYNGWRPSTGSFATEDDGVALRVVGWTHYKHRVGRWFYWQSTCYKNPSHVNHETNVFESAWTFGRRDDASHSKFGETGNNYSNGDGVLFYPGTECRYPKENYAIDGPIASLRLKHWRRGIQDVDYLTMAAKVNPDKVNAIVQKMIPKTLWEVGVTDPNDPTYVHTDISWSTNPDVWEKARRELAEIIMSSKEAAQ